MPPCPMVAVSVITTVASEIASAASPGFKLPDLGGRAACRCVRTLLFCRVHAGDMMRRFWDEDVGGIFGTTGGSEWSDGVLLVLSV